MATQIKSTDAVPLPSNPGHKLRADAANAWERANAAAGLTPELTDSFRPVEVQERIFRERYVAGNHAGKPGFTNDVRTWNGVKYTRKAGTAAAAVPGTSNHGGGLAVDVRTSRNAATRPRPVVVFTGFNDVDRLNWLKAAKPHGWADDEGRSVNEPWHLTYYPARDQHKGQPSTPPTPKVCPTCGK